MKLTEEQRKAIERTESTVAIVSTSNGKSAKGFQSKSEKAESRPFGQPRSESSTDAPDGYPTALGELGSADKAAEEFLNRANQALNSLETAERQVIAQNLIDEANRFSQDVQTLSQAYAFYSDVRVKIALAKLEALAQIEAKVEADTNFFTKRSAHAIETPLPQLPSPPLFSGWQQRLQSS